MTEVRQNFSLIAGDDTNVDYGIAPTPDDPPLDLAQAEMTWTAYPQMRGVADKTGAVIVKSVADGGIEIEDAAEYTFAVFLQSADTMDLGGNYYYEIVVIDPANDNRRSTTTIGTMTVIDTGTPLNVVAFKSMFPQFESVDDGVLQTALDEAGLYVDDTWTMPDAITATFYLAAHFVSVTLMTASTGGISGTQVTQEHIGQISVSYGAGASSGSTRSSGYPSLQTTNFGLMFLALMRRHSPGIAIV